MRERANDWYNYCQLWMRSQRSLHSNCKHCREKAFFNWEPSDVTSNFGHFLPLKKNRNISTQLRRRWFPEACVTHINQWVTLQRGRSCGLWKKEWRNWRRREEVEGGDKPMDALAACQEGAERAVAKGDSQSHGAYTSSQRCFSTFSVRALVFVLMNVWSNHVWCFLTSSFSYRVSDVYTYEWKWMGSSTPPPLFRIKAALVVRFI